MVVIIRISDFQMLEILLIRIDSLKNRNEKLQKALNILYLTKRQRQRARAMENRTAIGDDYRMSGAVFCFISFQSTTRTVENRFERIACECTSDTIHIAKCLFHTMLYKGIPLPIE